MESLIDVMGAAGRASRLFTYDGTMDDPRPLIKRPHERIIPSHIDLSTGAPQLFVVHQRMRC